MLMSGNSDFSAVIPRFEFRTFGQHLDKEAKRMARLSVPVPENLWERHSDEVYLVSSHNDSCNAKIRNGKIDIKTLLLKVDGLEQWSPFMLMDFPISVEKLKNDLFRAFQVAFDFQTTSIETQEEFIELMQSLRDIQVVTIHKQRFAYQVNGTICETGTIIINGARVETISVESGDIAAVKKTMREIGLEDYENINYVQMIKRVTGWIHQPLAN